MKKPAPVTARAFFRHGRRQAPVASYSDFGTEASVVMWILMSSLTFGT